MFKTTVVVSFINENVNVCLSKPRSQNSNDYITNKAQTLVRLFQLRFVFAYLNAYYQLKPPV